MISAVICEDKRMILFVNACVRSNSRTKRLADRLISKWNEPVSEVLLKNVSFPGTDEAFLIKREQLVAAGDLSNPVFSLAVQFAKAEKIVIAAPYWDLSFPASLKQYFEQINVVGITFSYTPDGVPQGLCNAKQLFYVTTAGGDFAPDEYGFGYVKALAQNYYGIQDVQLIKAVGLDLAGADPEQILKNYHFPAITIG